MQFDSIARNNCLKYAINVEVNLYTHLEQCDVVVVSNTHVVIRMRDHPLHLQLLAEIGVRVSSGNAQLYRPTRHVRMTETVDVE